MNTLHDTAPTTTSNLPTERQIKNFDPTALIQTFRLEYEDANQHDHLNVLIEQTAAPEKKKLHDIPWIFPTPRSSSINPNTKLPSGHPQDHWPSSYLGYHTSAQPAATEYINSGAC